MSFPPNFIWATATAAYQIEGGGTENGRGKSTWDAVVAEEGRIAAAPPPTQNGAGYEKWKEDVQLIKQLGVSHYRFSLSWSRLIPEGEGGRVNEEGVQHYLALIQELKKNNIEPIVTLFHSDWPLCLFERGGWLNEESVRWYEEFARLCFERFSHLVPYWITFNEIARHAWSDVSRYEGEPWHCVSGPELDDSIPYLVAHRMIIAHAKVYRMYRQDFYPKHKGQVGVVGGGRWCIGDLSKTSAETVARAMNWMINWEIDPIVGSGDYPASMRERLDGKEGRALIPAFTKEEKELVKGSADFLGINYYVPVWVEEVAEEVGGGGGGSSSSMGVRERHGHFRIGNNPEWELISGPDAWIRNVPSSLFDLLCYVKKEYGNIPAMISENGCPDRTMGGLEGKKDENPLEDDHRIRYIGQHVAAVRKALSVGCDVIGYTVWSLMDNFEWSDGFEVRFGLYRVDFESENKERTAKKSVEFYRKVIESKGEIVPQL